MFRVFDRVDIFRIAGASNTTVERSYDRGGEVKVMLTPVKGIALIYGAAV